MPELRASFHNPILWTQHSNWACFPIPFGFQVVLGPINDQTTDDIFDYISASSGDFWFTSTQTRSGDLQERILQLDAAKPLLLELSKDQTWAPSATGTLLGISEDNNEVFKEHIEVLQLECTKIQARNKSTPAPFKLTQQPQLDDASALTNDITNKSVATRTSPKLSAVK